MASAGLSRSRLTRYCRTPGRAPGCSLWGGGTQGLRGRGWPEVRAWPAPTAGPPLPASPEHPHAAPRSRQALAQHAQAGLAEAAVQEAQLRQGRRCPQGLGEVSANGVRESAAGQPAVEHTVLSAPPPPWTRPWTAGPR